MSEDRISDTARENIWKGVEEAAGNGVRMNDLVHEVGECWLEYWRQRLRDAENDYKRLRVMTRGF